MLSRTQGIAWQRNVIVIMSHVHAVHSTTGEPEAHMQTYRLTTNMSNSALHFWALREHESCSGSAKCQVKEVIGLA